MIYIYLIFTRITIFTFVTRVDELGRKADKPVKVLYGERKFQCVQDGLRFKSQADLNKHLELVVIRTKEKTKRSEGGLLCRRWYCRVRDWTTDFDTLNKVYEAIISFHAYFLVYYKLTIPFFRKIFRHLEILENFR